MAKIKIALTKIWHYIKIHVIIILIIWNSVVTSLVIYNEYRVGGLVKFAFHSALKSDLINLKLFNFANNNHDNILTNQQKSSIIDAINSVGNTYRPYFTTDGASDYKLWEASLIELFTKNDLKRTDIKSYLYENEHIFNSISSYGGEVDRHMKCDIGFMAGIILLGCTNDDLMFNAYLDITDNLSEAANNTNLRNNIIVRQTFLPIVDVFDIIMLDYPWVIFSVLGLLFLILILKLYILIKGKRPIVDKKRPTSILS